MTFFRQQQTIKQRTALLIFLLIIAVFCLITLACFATATVLYLFGEAEPTKAGYTFGQRLAAPLSFAVAGIIISFAVASSIFKWQQLRRGGKAVAESLGARLISPDTAAPEERKVLQVVEEMAIASGTSVPNVYLVDDISINAFAAGNSRRDTVIGVTRGCIKILDREELQGVIAHEFSHIYNQDIRLNMRLVTFLYGISVFGLTGYQLTSSRRFSPGLGRSLSTVFGMILIILGYCGTLLSSFIKTAVSRQREFAADASAVQLTCNPASIDGALKKIGGLAGGSYLSSGRAAEFSHMFFGQGIKTSSNGPLSTHPPLVERIKRISPNWNGSYEIQKEKTAKKSSGTARLTQQQIRDKYPFKKQATAFIGAPEAFHRTVAEERIAAIPATVMDNLHNPYAVRAIVYALLVDPRDEILDRQGSILESCLAPHLFDKVDHCFDLVKTIPRNLHLTVIELCLPAIKQLSEAQFLDFKKTLIRLIEANKKIPLHEWCLYKIIVQNYWAEDVREKYTLRERQHDISLLFSLIVYAGKSISPGGAFSAAINTLEIKDISFKLSDEAFTFNAIEGAVDNLCQLKLAKKQNLLCAIAAIIDHNDEQTGEAAELFRAISDILDCPIPPLIV